MFFPETLELKLCRLCLSTDNLVDVFYSSTPCVGINHLHTCILLSTGVNILLEDNITKYVCKACCDLSLKIFQFRKAAIVNERALKAFKQLHCNSNYPIDVDKINELNKLIYNSNIKVRIIKENERTGKIDLQVTDDYAVHPSVLNIIKKYENIILPNKVLKLNLTPSVALNSSWVDEYSEIESSEMESDGENSETSNSEMNEINKFKIKSGRSKVNKRLSSRIERCSKSKIKDKDYIPYEKIRKRKKSSPKHIQKRSKSNQQMLKASEKVFSLSLHNIVNSPHLLESCITPKQDILSYDMFFQPREVIFIKDLFQKYSSSDERQIKDSKEVNTFSDENVIVRQDDRKHWIIEDVYSQLSVYHIPIVYEYSSTELCEIGGVDVKCENRSVQTLLNPSPHQLWSECDIINLKEK